MKDANVPKFLQ